jgi:hypothetical protein
MFWNEASTNIRNVAYNVTETIKNRGQINILLKIV